MNLPKLKKNRKRNSNLFSEILLFIFILLLPTQFGKHLFFNFSYLSGIRVDYLAPTIYLTDIIILILAVLNYQAVFEFLKRKKVLIFLAIVFTNVLVSKLPPISAYHFLKILELIILIAVLKKNILIAQKILFGFLLAGLFQLFLAVLQFNFKHSLQGIFYFFGERSFSLSTPGIAKASLFGVEILRPYATFSHPNSLGGFFLLVYFLIISIGKFRQHILIRNLLLLISGMLIFLSFSKVVILTFLFLNLIFLWRSSIKKQCLLCFFSRMTILIVLSLLFIQVRGDPTTLAKRYQLTKNAVSILSKNLFTGTGSGAYLVAQNKIPTKFPDLLNQPVHNIFLLFITETGLIVGGLILLLFFNDLKIMFKKYPYLFSVILITGLFDHYWLTLQQNFLLLGVVFALL